MVKKKKMNGKKLTIKALSPATCGIKKNLNYL